MKSTVLDGLFTWSAYQHDRRIDFNGFFWARDGGNVLFDPIPLGAAGRGLAREHGGVRWIVLTNADHWRDTTAAREVFGAEVWAPDGERGQLRDRTVDGWFESAADLPDALRAEVGVHRIRGGKSPGETAFHLRPLGALLFGDVVRSHRCGELRLLPDDKLADRNLVCEDLRSLRELELRAVLLGDGDSMFAGAHGAFVDFLRALGRDPDPRLAGRQGPADSV